MTRPSDPAGTLIVVGMNHRTAAQGVRDKLFLEADDVPGLLSDIRAAGIGEAMVLSTCDRVEVVAVCQDPEAADRSLVDLLAARSGLSAASFEGQWYRASGPEAAGHLFAVAAALESQVVGEPQVLGQVKESHRLAAAAGMMGPGLESALQAAYGAAKRVRSETPIGEMPISIAAAAVQLAKRIHGDLADSTVLLLGLGEMGELLGSELRTAGAGQLLVVHESEKRAEVAAHRLGCNFRPVAERPAALAEAEVVIAASGTGRRTVAADEAEEALKRRRRRPMFFVDAAVPGDVDPAVGDLDGAFLYDLADLERAALEGRASRQATLEAARKILEEDLTAFLRSRAEREAVPAVVALRRHFEEVRESVLREPGIDAAEATRRLVNRLLHRPSEALRRAAADGAEDRETLERSVERLFDPAGRRSGAEPEEEET
ncbi:MAG: glutamyl-tRNA reductase [Kiloniellales bacterium]|nr:glutamyl-tRNA reductase [Kiloniellales bacterium]